MKSLALTRTALLLVLAPFAANGADWPTYLGNNSRVGSTSESLELPLSVSWTITPPDAPEMAWPGPEGREMERKHLMRRNTFDDAFHVAVVGDHVFYGSSVDHQVRCVDVASGSQVWTFFTEGPVRLAPTIHDGKVYIGSDDGYIYCLKADDGSLVWKMRPGPSEERILGRQQMISRWPVRTGITIHEDAEHGAVAYFGAGIFPHENVYLFAVNADNGEVIWKIDNISAESASRNDLSPQGYLLTTDEILVIPSGRSMPGVFDRQTGKLLHKERPSWRSAAGGVVGGTQALLADGQIYSWGAHHILAMDQKSGDVGFGWFAGHQMVISGDAAYVANGTEIARLDRAAYAKNSAVRHKLNMDIYSLGRKLRGAKEDETAKIKKEVKAKEEERDSLADVGFVWKTESPHESRLIVAGGLLFAGGEDEVVAFDVETGEAKWSEKVAGEARGLAAAAGRLFVSTDTGDVTCFATGEGGGKLITFIDGADPYPEDALRDRYAAAADSILEIAGVDRGFCLVAGAEQGLLAFEIAKRSQLEILCVEPDAEKVATARKMLAQTGYYGSRISFHHGELDEIPYANFFANLIVSDTAVMTGKLPAGLDQQLLARHVKPVGGKIVLGADSRDWLAGSGLEESSVSEKGGYAVLERGTLPGAGSWSHQYGEPGNTACSDDFRVKGGLGVLWFGDPGEGKMVNRHEGAVGPLAINGRLFAQGETRIMAYDAYNGLFLWERENPDSIRTGVFQNQNPGNLVASPDSLFFMERERCVQLDAATGEESAIHLLPEDARDGSREWGFVAYQDGILYGTATVREELEDRLVRRGRTTEDMTDGIFAIDVETGKHLWHYRGQNIEHRTVAIGEDSVFFIDSSVNEEQRQAILRQDKTQFENLTPEEQKKAEAELKKQDLRLAVAIDSRSGEKQWEKAVDVTDCSDIGIGGGKLTLIYRNGTLVLCGANANGHYWTQFMSGEFEKRRLVVLSGKDGNKLWSKDANYRHRPIIVDDQIIAEPWSYDLYTGEQKMRQNPLTGEDEPWSIMRSGHHCGMVAAAPNMLTFRSGYTGFYDLEKDEGTKHFAGHRTGCWINAIPANGLVSIPESSAGCVCLFSIASTIVMEPRERREDWAIISSTGAATPVKKIALNFGAPGDRRDENGTIWIGVPRPRPERVTSLDLAFDVKPAFANGGGWVSLNPDTVKVDTAAKDAAPNWVYSSWANGLLMARIPLLGENDAPAKYTVRLHLAAPRADPKSASDRTFKIRLQGKAVVEEMAIKSGDPAPKVLEFKGVEVTDVLNIEQWASDKTAPAQQLPVLNGVEIQIEN
jgi:outer membrane protein assembly factor BamB